MNCLLDTGPINSPPTVRITDLGPLHLGQNVTFTATIHDPNQSTDSLEVEWRVGGVGDDCDIAAAKSPPTCTGTECACNTPGKPGAFCVEVRATDRYGASASDSHTFTVEDRAPSAVLKRTDPLATANPSPFLSKLAFSAADSTDPDPGDQDKLTFSWTVTQPSGQKLSINTCPSPDTPALCWFVAEEPGTYRIQVIATDPSQTSSEPASLEVEVAQDQPPCIAGFTPASLQTIGFADQTNSFIVTWVNDDGDPYPGSTSGTFKWFYRSGQTGDFARLSNPYNSNRLDFGPDVFAIGDLIQIRVQYQDRINRSLSACDQNADRCELNHDGCAQWVTWTVSFL